MVGPLLAHWQVVVVGDQGTTVSSVLLLVHRQIVRTKFVTSLTDKCAGYFDFTLTLLLTLLPHTPRRLG